MNGSTSTGSIAAISSFSSTNPSSSSNSHASARSVTNDELNPKMNLLDEILKSNVPDGFKQKCLEIHNNTINKIINNF